MDNLDKNKIGESFEQQLPDEQLPEFIWDNLKLELDKGIVEPNVESTESIKESFEGGFEQEALPAFLWDDIIGELDANATLDADLATNNKIKSSFEGKYQDIMPEDLWDNVEDQLEIESVWQRVHKALNRRTRKRYWQEKGMQLGIAALAILWLRGCGVGEYVNQYTNNPSTFAHQENIESVEANTTALSEKNAVNTGQNKSVKATTEKQSNTQALNDNPSLLAGNNQDPNSESRINWSTAVNKTLATSTNNNKTEEKESTVTANNQSPVVTAMSVVKKSIATNAKENNPSLNNTEGYTVANEEPSRSKFTTLYNSKDKDAQEVNTVVNPASRSDEQSLNNTSAIAVEGNTNAIDNTNSQSIVNANTPILNKNVSSESNENLLRQEYTQTMLATLMGMPIVDSTIYTIQNFEIKNVAMKKGSKLRFELGLIGKAGTALLLGNAMDKAMESTSMIKTEIRPGGAVGIQMKGQLTRNDALVFAAYPFSVSSQYFGGYTRGGRFYHKEIKLEYFDLSLGYQRTLFHYNDFGAVPSTMYARVEYGLGYLNKSEEHINGELVNDNTSYKKFNHSIGLAVGSTHQIKRFVVDYGINANMGMTSISNNNAVANPVMEQTNLLNVGGYLGLRYIL